MTPTRLAGKLFFICYSVIAGLLLTEAALWLFFPAPLSLESRKTLRNTIAGLKEEYVYSRDADGFRSLSMRSQQKPSNTIRIMCLGASTTDQGTQSTEDTWSGILEQKLNSEFAGSGHRIEVAARGFGGNSATDVLVWAKDNALKYQPDMVILLLGVNDLCWHGGPDYVYTTIRDRLDRSDQNPAHRRQGSWKSAARKYSQVVRRLAVAWNKYEMQKKLSSGQALEWHSSNLKKLREQYRRYPYLERPVRNPDPIIEFKDALKELLGYFNGSNVPVIVLGQPTLWKAEMSDGEQASLWFYVKTPQGPVRPGSEWLEEEMELYNRAQERIANDHGMTYIDLDRRIPKRLSHMFDDCHFTDLGSSTVADEIVETVSRKVDSILNKSM